MTEPNEDEAEIFAIEAAGAMGPLPADPEHPDPGPVKTEPPEEEETPEPTKRMRRTPQECKAMVRSIDDQTVADLLMALAKEAQSRGIDPMVPVTAVTAAAPAGGTGTGRPASMNDLWARVVSRLDRTRKGGFRFEGTPIFGRHILGRDMRSVGVNEDGRAAPVIFGRKDMRGSYWLAAALEGESFDMDGTPIAGMKLLAKSAAFDEFERLCDTCEALLSGVEATKVADRRSVEEKLAAADDWE